MELDLELESKLKLGMELELKLIGGLRFSHSLHFTVYSFGDLQIKNTTFKTSVLRKIPQFTVFFCRLSKYSRACQAR